MRQGFTLIELSIVLVIIGLVAGGILVGEELISAARTRSQISQIEKYTTAANVFRDKYRYLPGDIPGTQASNFGFATRSSAQGQGDGNGVIEPSCGNLTTGTMQILGEVGLFWMDLSQVGLIDGTFTSAGSGGLPDITTASTPALDAFLPKSRMGRGGYIYIYNNALYNGIWHTGSGTYFGISAVSLVAASSNYCNVTSSPNITVQEASSIDSKTDDGNPVSGNVRAQYLNSSLIRTDGSSVTLGQSPRAADAASSTSCFDNANGANTNYAYSGVQNNGGNVNCALSFKLR